MYFFLDNFNRFRLLARFLGKSATVQSGESVAEQPKRLAVAAFSDVCSSLKSKNTEDQQIIKRSCVANRQPVNVSNDESSSANASILLPIDNGISHFVLGFVLLFSFLSGCVVAVLLLKNRDSVGLICERARRYFEVEPQFRESLSDCNVCGVAKCRRHQQIGPMREPWKALYIDDDLDKAVDSFFTRILKSFVESWFTQLSNDEEFVLSLKLNLREATCRLILKLKEVNVAKLLTQRLLPCYFAHYECVHKMLHDGVPLDRLANQFKALERTIHPAVLNRNAELEYLRAVAVCLIPRLCNNHNNFDSKVFFSLTREILASFVLLPLMDVIADPNLINLLVIVATNKPSKVMRPLSTMDRVMLLKRFVGNRDDSETAAMRGNSILTDQTQLYAFMQFLKKEGAVDVLRFYLDVDSLNNELLDPKVTTDPAKLSSLHQQSEKLLQTYQTTLKSDNNQSSSTIVNTLAEAHDHVKQQLQSKWQRAFHRTPEYFRLVYGGREIIESEEPKDIEPQGGFRLGSKLKGAIRSAIDGAPLDGNEIPTVWHVLNDDEPISSGGVHSSGLHNNPTIYTSVTQKLRKERGQHLENFIGNFMQSIEQTIALGEDAAVQAQPKKTQDPSRLPQRKLTPPGRNLVFGDLFELKKRPFQFDSNASAMNQISNGIKGPSKCMIYIAAKILKTPTMLVRLLLALVSISQSMVDHIICRLIDKLIRFGLYEPRLTSLLSSLESHLFEPKTTDPSPGELLERQRQAKIRLEKVYKGLASVVDVLQSPALNKQLMYCLFDIVLIELYPELEHVQP